MLLAISLWGCSQLFFLPTEKLLQTPAALGLDYRDVELTAADGTRLHSWLLSAKGDVNGTILFLHGNAENISTHIHNVSWLPDKGYQVLLLDYRGFGGSAGHPTLATVLLDIDAGIDWLLNSPATAEQPLYILGQSIGASLMLHAVTAHANNPRLCAIVSDAAFTRYSDIVRHVAAQSWLTWWLQYPLAWGMGAPYDPIDAVSRLDNVPILFIHSRDDEIVPFAYLAELISSHQGPSQRMETSGPHTATFSWPENRSLLLDYLASHRCGGKS